MEDDQQIIWSIAIFAARENIQTLEKTISAALVATSVPTVVDILVNGNLELAEKTAELICVSEQLRKAEQVTVRVWFIKLGDKAHTWNQYLQFIWPKSRLAFFIDGYVRVKPDALHLIDHALSGSSAYLAGTGVPSVGGTAKSLRDEMLKSGGIHGNLFALKDSTIELIRESNFKLPLGLYRTDPTLGAVLSFNMEPLSHSWNPQGRILVHPEASWDTDEKKLWRFRDVSGQLKRTIRQGQGILENLAVKDHLAIRKLPPEKLPITAAELVLNWVYLHPWELLKAIFLRPILIGFALQKLREQKNWGEADTPPRLISS